MTLALSAGGTPCLVLPPLVDLAYAAQLKAVLLEALNLGKGIDIDASDVQRVATPCLQILAAAARSFAQTESAPLVFSKVSDAFFQMAATLAVGSILGLEGA
jgi:anti-anti-sigma regulatory factor